MMKERDENLEVLSYEHYALFLTYTKSEEYGKKMEEAMERGKRDLAEIQRIYTPYSGHKDFRHN